MILVVVGDVVDLRRVCEQPLALFHAHSYHERSRFGGWMRRQPRHEGTTQLQHRRAVPPRCGFNARQREAECLDDLEVATIALRATAGLDSTHT
jgi:hypothetical protein